MSMDDFIHKYVQTDTIHGNCWQTAVACILRVPPESLPCQVTVEKDKLSFHNKLNAYLEKHWNRIYSVIYDYQLYAVLPRPPGLHLMIGPTVRTPVNGRHHVVVAKYGEMIWDPHPSHAGLTSVESWGLFGEIPERIIKDRMERSIKMDPQLVEDLYKCVCPSCRPGYSVNPILR